MGSLKGKDILHGNQFSSKEIDAIIKTASELERELKKKISLFGIWLLEFKLLRLD